ncbi:NAD-dependent epimerase/dehydratase family protein [Sphaerochaeta sp.]|uniref:NAD-dependent epimerase/dehydratase family protein n=1 Tax=Sphaerochaeta sp. TaxID=1972642 RepID=UPI002FC8FD6A
MKRVILTGGTGAIGLALIQELICNGIEVLVLCRSNSPRNVKIPKHTLVTKVFCDLEQLHTLQNDTGTEYDVFYHLAWDGTFGATRNDMELQINNIRFALDAVHVAERFGCKSFIGIGSQAEYGPVNTKLTASTPTFPVNGYGMAKLCAGQMTRMEAIRLGLRQIWVRVLSVYGPNDGENTLVMSLVNKLRNGIIPDCTLGEQIWDYLYSEDAAIALRLIGEKGVDGKVYVLGSGTAKPLKDYILQIQEEINPNVDIRFGTIPYAENQIMYLHADISELTADTGFMPKYDFSKGIGELKKLLLN